MFLCWYHDQNSFRLLAVCFSLENPGGKCWVGCFRLEGIEMNIAPLYSCSWINSHVTAREKTGCQQFKTVSNREIYYMLQVSQCILVTAYMLLEHINLIMLDFHCCISLVTVTLCYHKLQGKCTIGNSR